MTRLEILERKLAREKLARKEAERLLEDKSLELYSANLALQSKNVTLIDDAKTTSKRLAEAEGRYESLLNSVSDVIYSVNTNGIISYCNNATSKILGYHQSELIGEKFYNFIPKNHKSRVVQFYKDQLNLNNHQSFLEVPIQCKSGQIVWFGQNVSFYNLGQTISEAFVVARDITEAKSINELLKTSEEKYRGIIENMELGLLEVLPNGKIHRAFNRFCAMTGYEAHELLGKDASSTLLPPEYLPVMEKQSIDRALGNAGVYEIELFKKNGDRIWVLISGAPILDSNNEVVGTIGIHYDISDRKQLEQDLILAKTKAERAENAEKQFLANMSHEIRTPINAVLGMSHLLYDTPLNHQQRDYLDSILYSAELLTGLVSDILDISKIEAGELSLNKAVFNLRPIIESTFKTIQFKYQSEYLKFNLQILDDVPEVFYGDQLAFAQILTNLLGNSAKFTRKGFVTLTVLKNKSNICLSVKDSGIGISEDQLKHVFKPFKQASGEEKVHYKGTGLGLSISKRLVELHEGQISVTSQINIGTEFFVTLPNDSKIVAQKSTLPKKQNALNLEQRQYHILIVEDNEINQKYISNLLKNWRFEVSIASNGHEAINATENENFDLIFMDIRMPGINGYETTIKIRNSLKKHNQQVPIIALTASALQSERSRALNAGMTDYLTKPFAPNQLSEIIAKHFATNKLKDDLFQFSNLLDAQYLLKTYGTDLEYAQEIFSIFIDQIDDQIRELVHAWQIKDKLRTRELIHKIKPTFMMVGLSELYHIASAALTSLENDHSIEIIDTHFNHMMNLYNTGIDLVKAELIRLKETNT